MMIMVMLEVVLLQGKPTSTLKKKKIAKTRIVGGFLHIMVSAQHPPCQYLGLGVTHIIIQVILNLVLVFMMVMVKVVWFLVPPTLPPKTFILSFMVVVVFFSSSR